MYVKKYPALVLAILVAAFLTACGGGLPSMTEDEYNHTIEYAAGVLMKYSNNGQERLIYVDAAQLQKQRKKEEGTTGISQEQVVETPEPAEPEIEEQTDVAGDTVETLDDTIEVTDASGDMASLDEAATSSSSETSDAASTAASTDTADAAALSSSSEAAPEKVQEKEKETASDSSEKEGTASDKNAIVLSSEESKEVVDDIFLSYQGYMVSSTYPESSKSYVVNADKGKKLLVLRFDLYNGSDRDRSVNFIPMNLMFQIILNGKNIGYSSVTFLPNDLASYSGNIESRAHQSVVVLTQISSSEATNIQNLGMVVTRNGSTTTYALE
ncbi:MAG: hypothetical protein K6E91_11400 [Butyrivibrio sp.]|nr:hypothetical protein [Butyrivibrio sp.]